MAVKTSKLWGASLVGLALSLLVGCGGKPPEPGATPSTKASGSPVASASATPGTSSSPEATGTPDASSSPDPSATPQGKTAEEKDYEKFKAQAESLTLGKGYAEAVPLLRDCLKRKPDDAQVHFYLMLCLGNLEDEPSTESEAYAFAKKVQEHAPGTPMAERASDYINSAESEPEKQPPDLEAVPIEGARVVEAKKDTAYILAAPVTMYITRVDNLTPDVKKKLWFLEVIPDSVPAEEKLDLPKGTSISIQQQQAFYYSKNTWRGGQVGKMEVGAENGIAFDKTWFIMSAFQIRVENGPNKGQRGWFNNQLDRYRGFDEDGKRVWGVKVAPRLVLKRG